ncbi:MAG TPA: DUF6265 family protein [Burkholderiaceae bacterium]|nr:DUF6265 family protein [Burkholderiaceae bacterium]
MSIRQSSVAQLLGAVSLAATAQSPAMPAFMAGCWAGEHADGRRSSYEVWMAPKAERMLGISQTVRPDRTEFEFMRIERAAGNVEYVAQPSGHPPTRFRMTEASATHADFVNPEHDFPQRIRYAREGDLLRAEISGGNPVRRIEFRFRKVACESLTN